MKSVEFPGTNIAIGKNQEDVYNVLHAMVVPGPEGELIIKFELTPEDIARIVEDKCIYYHRLTFGSQCRKCGEIQPFQPMRIDAGDLDHGINITGL